MEKPINIRHLTQQEVLTAQTEIMRCLIILLLGKGIISYPELQIALDFAKQRLNSPMHDKRLAKGAVGYVDLLWATLQPDEPSRNPTQLH